jgi:cbb3-type cytochrome oxidase subunit 3
MSRAADNGRNKGAVGVAEGKVTMWLIVEAFLALALLLFAVWWTMFSGRRKGERPGEHDSELPPPQ